MSSQEKDKETFLNAIHSYLIAQGFTKAAKSLRRQGKLGAPGEVDSEVDLFKIFQESKKNEVVEKKNEETEEPKENAVAVKSEKKKSKKRSRSESEEEIQPRKKVKKSKSKKEKSKAERELPSDTEVESVEPESVKEKKKKKKEKKNTKAEEATEDVAVKNSEQTNGVGKADDEEEPLKNDKNNKKKKTKAPRKANTPFQRIIPEEIVIENEELRDNSFHNLRGSETNWGFEANRILEQVKGKDFRHEKTKKKRGSYRGGTIDLGVNSVKFDDSDDE